MLLKWVFLFLKNDCDDSHLFMSVSPHLLQTEWELWPPRMWPGGEWTHPPQFLFLVFQFFFAFAFWVSRVEAREMVENKLLNQLIIAFSYILFPWILDIICVRIFLTCYYITSKFWKFSLICNNFKNDLDLNVFTKMIVFAEDYSSLKIYHQLLIRVPFGFEGG